MNTRILRRSNSLQAMLVATTALVAAHAPLVAQAQQSAGEMKPLAVIALSGYDALVEDIDFAGSLAGQPNLSQIIEPYMSLYSQGLDRSKPIGVVVQSDGATFGGAVCLPVSDLQKFLAPLQPFGITTEDAGGGITKIVTPQQTVFVKVSSGWAFASPMQEMLAGLPEDPTELLSALSKEYDLGARVHVQNVPEMYRQMAMQQLDMGMQAGLKKLPDETDQEFAARKEMTTLQIDQFKQLITDIDELTIGLALDGAQQRAYLDFVYTAVPESKLASQIAMYSDAKTNFAGFFQPDAAMMMSFASKMGAADIAQVDQMFGAIRQQVKAAIDKEADLPSDEARAQMQSALDDFLAAFQATLKTGMMDGGAVLNLAPNSLTFVAGAFIGEPAKVESGLKKMAEVIKQKDANSPEVKWNVASHGDVHFHTLSLPIPENEEQPRQLFGETVDLAIGIGKQSVYFAAGRDCLNAVKGVIDASSAEPQKSVPPMEMTFALKQIIEMAASIAEDNEKPMLQSIAAMLANEAAGRDHVRIVMQAIPGGIRTRIEAEEGVLRAIGVAAMQAQMQAASVGQPQ